MNEDVLKEAIKKRWEKYHPNENKEDLFDKTNPYYFNDDDSNLIATMSKEDKTEYCNGSGNELDKKMKALHSSSAMTFNIFRNKDAKREVHIDDNEVSKQYGLKAGTYSLEFEKQLPVLNPRARANLDACLISRKNQAVILFEMKMTEWLLGTPSPLSKSYITSKKFPSEFEALIMKYCLKDNIFKRKDKKGNYHEYYKCPNDISMYFRL